MSSFTSTSTPPHPSVTLTPSEISACIAVKQSLLSKGHTPSGICNRCVAITTLNKKLRVEDAVEGYESLMSELAQYGINDFNDIYKGLSDYDDVIAPRLSSYAGEDMGSRASFGGGGARSRLLRVYGH